MSFEDYWKDENQAFDPNNEQECEFFMQKIEKMKNFDEYSKARLKASLKTELPFFAYSRKLALKWVLNNFIC